MVTISWGRISHRISKMGGGEETIRFEGGLRVREFNGSAKTASELVLGQEFGVGEHPRGEIGLFREANGHVLADGLEVAG